MKKPVSFAATTLAALLAACGGSDGGADPAPQPQNPAQGVYFGKLSSQVDFLTIVLENGQFHTIYEDGEGPAGVVHGRATAANGQFTSTQATDYPVGVPPVAVSINAQYEPGAFFRGTVSSGDRSLSFTGLPFPKAEYDYDKPARLADVAGPWKLLTLEGQLGDAAVAADGSFTARIEGCAVSGAFQPRASGKNVFDVTLNFGPAPCVLAGRSVAAHALVGRDSEGPTLLLTGEDEERKVSIAVEGIR